MKQLSLLALLAFSLSCFGGDKHDASAFFLRYIELSDKFDIEVTELYSDKAKIHTYRVYPHGLERAIELSGVQWKQLITRVMPMAKEQNDKSSFINISVSKQGDGYKIKADRYSELKCYTDRGYYMVLEPSMTGKLLIVEEYMETQPQTNC